MSTQAQHIRVIKNLRRCFLLIFFFCLCLTVIRAEEVTWTYCWKPAGGKKKVRGNITPLLYGKSWAYTVEIDDGPICTKTVAEPLFSAQHYTDAPPGLKGGASKPFVGGMAIIGETTDGNSTNLSWDDIRALQAKGWDVINHSYWHSGYHWKPEGKLTPEQFRRELYWSQVVIGHELFEGKRTASHMVYPNGYTEYGTYAGEFGIRSGSRVGGKKLNVLKDEMKLLDLWRSYLDEGRWKADGANALQSFPETAPAPGTVFVDFTHKIDKNPTSENYKRWQARLAQIGSAYGEKGSDSVWSAPTPALIAYALMRSKAHLTVTAGNATVRFPAALPGTPVTIHLTGLSKKTSLPTANGVRVFRKGSEAWITTPMLGAYGAPMPEPLVQRVYTGKVKKTVSFTPPIRLAAIRLKQIGGPDDDTRLLIRYTKSDGTDATLHDEKLGKHWGRWRLFPLVPGVKPPQVTSIHITTHNTLQALEVWAVAK